jgi:hypothetical protein
MMELTCNTWECEATRTNGVTMLDAPPEPTCAPLPCICIELCIEILPQANQGAAQREKKKTGNAPSSQQITAIRPREVHTELTSLRCCDPHNT